MLRTSVRPYTKVLGCRLKCLNLFTRQWQIAEASRVARNTRNYADQKFSSNNNQTPKVSGANVSSLSTGDDNLTSTKKLNQDVLPSLATSTKNSTTTSNPIPSDHFLHPQLDIPTRKPRNFFRKFLSFTIVFQVLGFGGGVYLSSINDNFHDFFTEYVPFGEQAVLYLEEREFRKRFPTRSDLDPKDLEKLIRVPRQSGVSWRVAEEQKSGFTGRHVDATTSDSNLFRGTKAELSEKEAVLTEPLETNTSKSQTSNSSENSTTTDPKQTEKLLKPATYTGPDVDEPSKLSPKLDRIDPFNVNHANEPLVQDLVKIINNIITVVDADNSNAKFSSTIDKAKADLSTVGSKIISLKEQALKDAENKIQAEKEDFDRAAKELIRRVETEMQHQQASWQEEYQTEREKIQKIYENRLSTEIQRANELNEQRLRNALLEQALEMKKQFTKEINDRVEEERNGRLKKISDLSNAVTELEKLTSNWNSVVDFNLKTQQLHVAIEATRMLLENSEEPRPFVRELVALREIASDDPVVNAAIGSINPISYHHGIPSSAQIIDRFRRVAIEVRKAALLPEDAGVASHASSYILSKLLFKKKGLAAGDDVESVLTRAETLLEEGNIDAAAREVNGLKGWAKTLSRDWLDEVRRVLEVRQALDVIATEARLKSLIIE